VRRPLAILLLPTAVAAVALAQDSPQQGGTGATAPYAGVVPGTGNLPPRAPTPGGSLLMTWPGFQQRPDGASRFFLQTTAQVQVEQRNEQDRFVLVMRNTGLHLRNNRRPLETRYFNTPVRQASIERRGRDLAFVLDLRAPVTPVVSQEVAQTGYNFVYIELPAGSFIPEDLRLERSQSPAEAAGATSPSRERSGDDTTEIVVY